MHTINRINAGRWLYYIEKAGNRLPHPTAVFVLLAALMLPISWLFHQLEVNALHPISHKSIFVKNLLSIEGFNYIFTNTISNFTNFAPVGSVLIAMLGLGIAEHSGLLRATLNKLVKAAPPGSIVFIVASSGILSNIAVDAGYVVLIPLAGTLFLSAGKHPVAGIALAFAGVSAGFSANILLGPFDAIMSGLTQANASLIDPDAHIPISANYYFMATSCVFIALTACAINKYWVAPYLSSVEFITSKDSVSEIPGMLESRALRITGMTLLVILALIAAGTVPEAGILRNPTTHGILDSAFVKGSVVVISVIAALCGLAYGIVSGRFKNSHDIIGAMEKSIKTMSSYIVLMFFAAQFVAFFNWTEIGAVTAIHGANWLAGLALPGLILLLIFMLLTSLLNLFVGSASAKWALLAPIFVPMFMLLGIAPEATTAAYRVADSVTNVISPLMPYFGVVLVFVQKYSPKSGLGTLAAIMLPYSIGFGILWTLLFIAWYQLSIPFGF